MSNVPTVEKLPLKSYYIKDFMTLPEAFEHPASTTVLCVLMGRRVSSVTLKMETFSLYIIEYRQLVHCLNKLDVKNKEYLVRKCPPLVKLDGFKCPQHIRESALLELF